MDASTNRKLGVVAVVVVALAAGGAALAASRLHGSGSSSSLRGAGPPGFTGGAHGSFGYGDLDGDHQGFGRPGVGGGPFGGGLSAATTYLGLSQSDLRTQLASGKTLAQIANATNGKSAAGLIDALVAAEQKELDQAVSSNRLTQSQADQLKANLKARVTAMVDGSFGPGRGRFGSPGFGRPNGSSTTTTPPTHI